MVSLSHCTIDCAALAVSESEPVAFTGAGGLPLVGDRYHGPRQSVLLAHGFGQTRQSWSSTQQRLAAAGYRSLSWDTRGHGASGRNAGDEKYQLEQFVQDTAAAAHQLPVAPILVGASMGGLTGLLAQARQRVFSALVLVDVTPHWEAVGMQRITDFMTAFEDGFDSYEHAATAIANYLPHRRQRKSAAQLQHLLRADARGRLHWHWDRRLLDEFVLGSDHLQEEIAVAARQIDVPVLLISGGKSDLVSGRTIAHFLELVPHARHQQLPEATHMVAGDDNDAFSDTLLSYLDTHLAGP